MGTILQFAERLAEAGDWTPAERSQLRDMGTQLGQTAAGLDLVFGKTEEGDPWCVVADDRSEVLLHVARIGGGFVVHAPRNDQVIESHDLWLAVSRVLGGVLRDRRGLILPFPPQGMGQPAALALMLAAAVRGDFDHIVQAIAPAAPTPDDKAEASPMPALPASVPTLALVLSQAHDAASQTRHAAPVEAAQAPPPAAHTATAVGAAAATALAAGHAEAGPLDARTPVQASAAPADAAPVHRTAPEPGHVPTHTTAQSAAFAPAAAPNKTDLGAAAVSGGGGGEAGSVVSSAPAAPELAPVQTERAVAVQNGLVATGQAGTADAFVLTAPVRTEGSNVVSLGTVSGFSLGEGDRLVFANGATPTVVEVVPLNPLSTGQSGLTGEAAHRISYDFDGDGREDAFVVVIDAPVALTLHKAADIAVAGDMTVTVQGVAAAASIVIVFIGQ